MPARVNDWVLHTLAVAKWGIEWRSKVFPSEVEKRACEDYAINRERSVDKARTICLSLICCTLLFALAWRLCCIMRLMLCFAFSSVRLADLSLCLMFFARFIESITLSVVVAHFFMPTNHNGISLRGNWPGRKQVNTTGHGYVTVIYTVVLVENAFQLENASYSPPKKKRSPFPLSHHFPPFSPQQRV